MASSSASTGRHRDAAAFTTGLAVTTLAALVADRHPALDRRVFKALNDHASEPAVLRLVQQLGTPWMLPATALAGVVTGRPRLALAAALALPVEKAFEVGIKKVRRTPRPVFVQPTVLRDDAPVEGESFPSGHAAIAFTAAGLIAPHLSVRATTVALALATGTALVRVSQGAHHPIDVVAGGAMGLGVAGGLNYVVGRGSSPSRCSGLELQ